ncbi:MAG: phage shock protein PspA [Pseudomonadales bacterium]|jgi:phage shock protein A
MGIFSRVSDIINANLNALLDKAEDPEKMVRLMIQEMEETLVEVRTQSARLIADKKEVARQRDRYHTQSAEWGRKAEVALSKDREDLAREALREQIETASQAEILEEELNAISLSIEALSQDVEALQQKLLDAKTRRKALILKGETAQQRKGVRRQLHSVNLDEALNKFDAFERRIDELEGEIEAYDLGQRSLADEIAALEADEDIDAAMAALKARLAAKQDASAAASND